MKNLPIYNRQTSMMIGKFSKTTMIVKNFLKTFYSYQTSMMVRNFSRTFHDGLESFHKHSTIVKTYMMVGKFWGTCHVSLNFHECGKFSTTLHDCQTSIIVGKFLGTFDNRLNFHDSWKVFKNLLQSFKLAWLLKLSKSSWDPSITVWTSIRVKKFFWTFHGHETSMMVGKFWWTFH